MAVNKKPGSQIDRELRLGNNLEALKHGQKSRAVVLCLGYSAENAGSRFGMVENPKGGVGMGGGEKRGTGSLEKHAPKGIYSHYLPLMH